MRPISSIEFYRAILEPLGFPKNATRAKIIIEPGQPVVIQCDLFMVTDGDVVRSDKQYVLIDKDEIE